MWKRAAISATRISADLSRARMVLISLGVSFGGRPPVRPRALAAVRPATVLSRIRLRSNSASAAKTWKTRRPAGETVSIFSVSDPKLILRRSRSATRPTRSARFRPRRSNRHTTSQMQQGTCIRSAYVRLLTRLFCSPDYFRKRACGSPLGPCWLSSYLPLSLMRKPGRSCHISFRSHTVTASSMKVSIRSIKYPKAPHLPLSLCR